MSCNYDLFISFKNSEEGSSKSTIDSQIAKRLFEAFRKEKINTFFSNKVLSENGVANYMLEIQNALESAKVLLVIYSKISYIIEGWVAHEWMTYLNLMMKDPRRKIFLYSINGTISDIPPFLRPYECFTEYDQALTHVVNSILFNNNIDSTVSKRFFLSAYWGLFNDDSFDMYCNRKITEPFNNYDAYCLKWKYYNGLSVEKFIEELTLISNDNKSPLVTYLLSMQYRCLDFLDIDYSNLLRNKAYNLFVNNLHLKKRMDEEVALIIIEDKYKHYNGAFYMCDVINDVLEAYNISTCIYLFDEGNQNIDLSKYQKIVIFISNTVSYINNNMLSMIYNYEDKIYIGLNSFGLEAINYDFKGCKVFENTPKDITRICRLLLI